MMLISPGISISAFLELHYNIVCDVDRKSVCKVNIKSYSINNILCFVIYFLGKT